MTIRSSEIRPRLKEVFPKLKHVWLFDPEYALPTFNEVVAQIKWPDIDYARYIADCDKFALILHAQMTEVRAREAFTLPYEERLAWTFGQCNAKRLKGSEYFHALNIFLCEEGIYLVDPQHQEIWKAQRNSDVLFYLRM